MREHPAPGLTADWLNGWLAAIGVTVLLPDTLLRWERVEPPVAVFLADTEDLGSRIYDALIASRPRIAASAIAKHLDGRSDFPRTVTREAFIDRAELARRDHDGWLGASVTDLAAGEREEGLRHSPFDPPVPRGITLHERALTCLDQVEHGGASLVTRSFAGTASRLPGNGLGFDFRRLPAATLPNALGGNAVIPVVEILAFHALSTFPIRGNGSRPSTRGWIGFEGQDAFSWCVWLPPLDQWAVDALLDQFHTSRSHEAMTKYSVFSAFRSVAFRPRTTLESTRGYASVRVEC